MQRSSCCCCATVLASWVSLSFGSIASAQVATRELPEFPGVEITFGVSITLHPPAGTTAAGAFDTPPAGWAVTNISDSGTFDALTQQVKWGPLFSPPDPTVVSYDVTVPLSALGNECFLGAVSFGGPDLAILGDQCLVTIPAVSLWGLIILGLLILTAGSVLGDRLPHGGEYQKPQVCS